MPRTKQDLFDEVARKLRAQGRPSGTARLDGSFACLYRDPEGGKCGIGQLIPDEKYDVKMEGSSIRGIVDGTVHFPAVRDLIPDADFSPEWGLGIGPFLSDLQIAHDDAANFNGLAVSAQPWLGRWLDRMHTIAVMHDLNPAALTEEIPAGAQD